MTIVESIVGAETAEVILKECRTAALKQVKNEKYSSLGSNENRVTQLEKQVVEEVETFLSLYQEGADILENALRHVSSGQHEMVSKEIEQIMKMLPKQKPKTFSSLLLSKRNIRQHSVFKISKESLAALIEAAMYLMEQEKFLDAMKALYVLCTIEPNLYEMWITLGHAAFYAQQFHVSHIAYFMASTLKLESPWPFIWASNACEKKDENEQACALLEEAKVLAQKSSEEKERSLIREIDEKISLLTTRKK